MTYALLIRDRSGVERTVVVVHEDDGFWRTSPGTFCKTTRQHVLGHLSVVAEYATQQEMREAVARFAQDPDDPKTEIDI